MGHIEIRFRNIEDLRDFLQQHEQVNIQDTIIHLARKIIGGTINTDRYAI